MHVTEVDSFLTTARRGGLPLTDAEADRYVAEQAVAGALLGVPRKMAPHSVAEIGAYYAAMRPQLQVGAQAREAAVFVMHPPMPRKVALLTPARPAWYGLGAPGVRAAPPLGTAPCTGCRACRRPISARHSPSAPCTPALMRLPKAQRDGPALTARSSGSGSAERRARAGARRRGYA